MELVVIAAGQGSRFRKAGIVEPKPLVFFRGKPLFWWAAQSALSSGAFDGLHFAILREHIDVFSIDKMIQVYFPRARLHVIDAVTAGAAETAALVGRSLPFHTPVGFVDCDLAFAFARQDGFLPLLKREAAALCVFRSHNPAYSYVRFDDGGRVVSTVEKQVVSNWAIAGLYVFSSVEIYLEYFSQYAKDCEYPELFMSGVFNHIIAARETVITIPLSHHLPLGTPEDVEAAVAHETILPDWYSHP